MNDTCFLIQNATVVSDPLAGKFTTQAHVLLRGSLVETVGEFDDVRTRLPNAQVVDGSGCMLLPGLVDAHTHLYGALIAAMPAPKVKINRFADVLEYVWWVWDQNLTAEDLVASAQVGCAASFRNGITTIFDHHASPNVVDGSLSLLAAELGRLGMRACLAYEVTDRNGVDNFEAGVAENIRFAREVDAQVNTMLRPMFGMHAVFSLSDASLMRCAKAADDLGVGCHLHVAEHKDEVARFAAGHDQSILEYLAETGILSPKSLLAHTVHVEARDIEVMKESGTYNVHNPQSNLSNGVGIAPILEMRARGQKVCLGSDGFFNLPQQAGLAQMMQTTASGVPGALPDRQALDMMYGTNIQLAEEVFGCRLGKVLPGYQADLILVRYAPWLAPTEDSIHSEVLRTLQTGSVDTVWVDGRQVMKKGVITGLDESEMDERIHKAAESIHARLK